MKVLSLLSILILAFFTSESRLVNDARSVESKDPSGAINRFLAAKTVMTMKRKLSDASKVSTTESPTTDATSKASIGSSETTTRMQLVQSTPQTKMPESSATSGAPVQTTLGAQASDNKNDVKCVKATAEAQKETEENIGKWYENLKEELGEMNGETEDVSRSSATEFRSKVEKSGLICEEDVYEVVAALALAVAADNEQLFWSLLMKFYDLEEECHDLGDVEKWLYSRIEHVGEKFALSDDDVSGLRQLIEIELTAYKATGNDTEKICDWWILEAVDDVVEVVSADVLEEFLDEKM